MASMLSRPSRMMLARSSARPAMPSSSRLVAAKPVPARRGVVANAEGSSSGDFDDFLMKMADKFEKSENKPAVIGYLAAAVGAVFFAEWFIHLPLLDALIGFPIQLLGLAMLPILGVRYVVDKKDVMADLTDSVTDITKRLPGLDKK